eukprot:97212_1
MSSNQSLTRWAHLTSCPSIGSIHIPIGIDRNNYIAIDHNAGCNKINCIYKYNIENDKWIKMDCFNNVQNVSRFLAALDAKKQILFLVHHKSVTQMRLNTNHICNDNHNAEIMSISNSNSIIVNDSLFVLGGSNGNSILKWNSETKTLTKFGDMYNKMQHSAYTVIYNNKNNSLLFFGGTENFSFISTDYILEFNIKSKQWNKLPVSLPTKMDMMCCTMA